MFSSNGMMNKLAIVVTKTTLETSSGSFLYLVVSIDVFAAAGIAESRITTVFNIPVR